MTSSKLNDLLGVHSSGHHLLGIGVDAVVFGGDLVPRGLSLPGGLGDVVAKGRGNGGLLCNLHDKGLLAADVLAESLLEVVAVEPEVAVRVGRDAAFNTGGGGVLGGDAAGRLAGVGAKGSNVDKADDVGQVAGLSDDGTTVRVANKEDGAVDLANHLLGALDIVGERGEGHLHGLLLVAAGVHVDNDIGPVGGVAPEAVDVEDGRLGHVGKDVGKKK